MSDPPPPPSIDAAWSFLLERNDLDPAVREMIGAASSRPALRRLFPYLSLETRLRFSLRAEWPYSRGHPWLATIDQGRVDDGPAFDSDDEVSRIQAHPARGRADPRLRDLARIVLDAISDDDLLDEVRRRGLK